MGSDKRTGPRLSPLGGFLADPLARQPARTAKLSFASIDSPSPRAEACSRQGEDIIPGYVQD